MRFTEDEIVALVAGAKLIRAWGGANMAAGAEEALIKIAAVLPEGARARAEAVKIKAFTMSEMTDDLRAMIDRVEAAAEGNIRLDIDYADEGGATSQRVVRPLGLWFWGKTWTMVGWCEKRTDFRMFRLDRISGMSDAGSFKPQRGQTLRDFYADETRRSRPK